MGIKEGGHSEGMVEAIGGRTAFYLPDIAKGIEVYHRIVHEPAGPGPETPASQPYPFRESCMYLNIRSIISFFTSNLK